MPQNDNLILIGGATTTGKSSSLMYLNNPEGVMYLNTEGKKTPFPNKFANGGYNVTDPLQIKEAFKKAEEMPEIHTIVVDSLTFMLDQWESRYLLTASDTFKAWSAFQQFFKTLMYNHVAVSSKNVIFTGHTQQILNEQLMQMETCIPVKGALQKNGIEAYFSTIVHTKPMSLSDLESFENKYLTITEDDEIVGFKYVYQTRLTKDTIGSRIRSPVGMWNKSETFIDNNVQYVLDRLHEYYK